jgi:hydrogenase nickel incorporation protein HypB
MSQTVEVMEDIYAANDRVAEKVKAGLTARKVLTVNVLGAPGVGKTTSLVRTIGLLDAKAAVIEGDVEGDIDTVKLASLGISAVQVNTFGGCHLDAPQIEKALSGGFVPPEGGYLFIENIGNLICPAEFNIGEHLKLLICAAVDGSDKPWKYPTAFEKADAVLINKWDLREAVGFEEEYFMEGLRKHNPDCPVFRVSARKGEGFEAVAKWLEGKRKSI